MSQRLRQTGNIAYVLPEFSEDVQASTCSQPDSTVCRPCFDAETRLCLAEYHARGAYLWGSTCMVKMILAFPAVVQDQSAREWHIVRPEGNLTMTEVQPQTCRDAALSAMALCA